MSRLIDADEAVKIMACEMYAEAQSQGYDAVEVVRGKWIHNPKIGWGETWVCSICGEKTTSSVMGYPRYNYCPNCGAKMDVERKENDDA